MGPESFSILKNKPGHYGRVSSLFVEHLQDLFGILGMPVGILDPRDGFRPSALNLDIGDTMLFLLYKGLDLFQGERLQARDFPRRLLNPYSPYRRSGLYGLVE